MYQTTSHDEAYEQLGVQGTGFQTGVPARVRRASCSPAGSSPGTGVFAPEQVDPAPFLDLMTEHGAPWGVVDLPPDEELPI